MKAIKPMKIYLCFCFLICSLFFAMAQKKYTISGYAKDVQNGETLIGASITIKGNARGVASNQYGFLFNHPATRKL